MSSDGYSLSKLQWIYEQLGKDWCALVEAKEQFESRLHEAGEAGWPLDKWAGTDSILGALMMVIDHIERRREYYGDLINKVAGGEIENTDVAPASGPVLSVIEGGK